MTLSKAIRFIEKHGALLVFPIQNRPDPKSLWYEFFPKSEMRWEWDSDGDDRVAELWHLREELQRSKKVVYSKWYKGRATFFSREIYSLLLARMGGISTLTRTLSHSATGVLDCLLSESPLSTKQLKKRMKLEGRFNERAYEKSLKELWQRLLIVGVGEVDDGAFPSLSVGAAELMHEELVRQSVRMDRGAAAKQIEERLDGTPFLKEIQKLESTFRAPKGPRALPRELRGAELSIFSKKSYKNPT